MLDTVEIPLTELCRYDVRSAASNNRVLDGIRLKRRILNEAQNNNREIVNMGDGRFVFERQYDIE